MKDTYRLIEAVGCRLLPVYLILICRPHLLRTVCEYRHKTVHWQCVYTRTDKPHLPAPA